MVPAKARPGVTAALEARDAEDPYGALVDVKLAAGRPPRLQFGGANPAVVTVGGAPLLTAEDLARACAPLTFDETTGRAALPGQLHRVSRVLHRGAVAALSLRVGRHVAGAAHRLSDVLRRGESVLFLGAPGAGKSTAVRKSNLQPDFNVRVLERFDTSSLAGLRELDASNRSVQKSAKSTSM